MIGNFKAYVPESDLEYFNKCAPKELDTEFVSIEEHDKEVKLQVIEQFKERLMRYKPQIVDDIGLCVTATILDFFEHIPEELKEEL